MPDFLLKINLEDNRQIGPYVVIFAVIVILVLIIIAKVLKAKEEVEKLINKKGRVLLRESGTEPVIRVMVEAEAQELCVAYAEMIVKVIVEGGHCVE